MTVTNCTRASQFILLGLPSLLGMERVMYTSVFLLYLLCLMGNGLIIIMVSLDRNLQKPMYFFLSNLSLIDIGYTTAFIPKLLVNYITASNSICFYCCLIQMCFYFFFGVTEFFIITLISLDRYLAICHPLRYTTIMTSGVCLNLAITSWFVGFFSILYQVIMIANLPYCASNIIDHFFCDVGPVLQIAGGDIDVIEALGFLVTMLVVMSSLLFTLISYILIIFTILRMPSTTSQQRAFSTCASHLIVVFVFYGSVFFVYLRPTVKNSSFGIIKSVALVNALVAPMLNPFIYAIRNNEVKEAVCKALRKMIPAFSKTGLFGEATLCFKTRSWVGGIHQSYYTIILPCPSQSKM